MGPSSQIENGPEHTDATAARRRALAERSLGPTRPDLSGPACIARDTTEAPTLHDAADAAKEVHATSRRCACDPGALVLGREMPSTPFLRAPNAFIDVVSRRPQGEHARGVFVGLAALGLLAACSASEPGKTEPIASLPDAGATVGVPGASAPFPDGTCAEGRKKCDGLCVSLQDPTYGCASASCTPCSVPHGVAACVSGGACGIATCNAARADCNANATDGCETNTASRPEHCGGCGIVCASNQVCSNAACTSTCAAGLTPCAGACLDLTQEPTSCGACGRTCPATANGVATCNASTCGVACNSGYRACGARCEAESATSCGAACTVCPTPANGVALCTAGACGFKCNESYAPNGATCVDVGGATCNAVAQIGANVDIVTSRDAKPIAVGGAISDGTYVVTSVVLYGSSQSGSVVGSNGKATIRIVGNDMKSVNTAPDGSVTRINGAFSLTGTSLLFTKYCGVLSGNGTIDVGYTATPTNLYYVNKTDGIVSTLTKQ